MADTDAYQADAAGSAALSEAQQSTADQAAKQSAQNKAGVAAGAKAAQDFADAKTARTQKAGARKAAGVSTAKGASYQNQPGQAQEPAAGSVATVLGNNKKGTMNVPKTGAYGLTKGEAVVPADRASEYRKIFKSRGEAGKHSWGGK